VSDGEDGSSAVNERLAQLRVQFLRRSLQDVLTIRSQLPRVRNGDAAALTEIEFLSHRMYGLGSTLDTAVVTDKAGEIERVSAALMARAPASDESLVARLERATTQLERELEKQIALDKLPNPPKTLRNC
jgi:hypothetical protein